MLTHKAIFIPYLWKIQECCEQQGHGGQKSGSPSNSFRRQPVQPDCKELQRKSTLCSLDPGDNQPAISLAPTQPPVNSFDSRIHCRIRPNPATHQLNYSNDKKSKFKLF